MLKTSVSYKIAHRTTSKILKKNPFDSVIFVQRRQKSPLLYICKFVQKYPVRISQIIISRNVRPCYAS